MFTPGLIENRVKTGLFKLIDGHRRGDVIAQHNIQFGVDELACLDGGFPAMGGQDLLGHGHSHDELLLS